ncbi:LytTR family DNA-binding domain-containing protein [Spirosoma sp. 48-14]|nr:LytTR family DNA-binding domain-containing protein [Spirosoma sp. 48-14]
MLSVLVLDDEPNDQISVKKILEELGYTDINCVTSLEEARTFMKKRLPSLLIADVILKDSTSLELVYDPSIPDIPTIFMTVTQDINIYNTIKDNFRFGFLIKPLSPILLQATINLLFSSYKSNYLEAYKNKILYINQGRKMHKIEGDEILWLESEGNYTTIVISNGKKYTIKKSLKRTVEKLNNHFTRCHQRFYVNLKKVDGVISENLLINGYEIPIGITYKNTFMNNLNILDNTDK